MIGRLALALCLMAGAVSASPPLTSPRPQMRPLTGVPVGLPDNPVMTAVAAGQDRAETAMAPSSFQAVPFSPRPQERPAAITARAEAEASARRRGQVCDDPDIQGRTLPAIHGPGGCGIDAPVEVRSVAGVRLRDAGTMDCRTAAALKSWVEQSALPALRGQGGGLVGLRIAGTYTCRPRNNQSGEKLSEHGLGQAIDIAGFVLKDGSEISVLRGWGSGAAGAALGTMRQGACGIFGTVLGPGTNAFHRDHFHFDTARYRSGSYCR